MGSCADGEIAKEDEDPLVPLLLEHTHRQDQIGITLQQPLLNPRTRRRRLLDFLRARPSLEWLKAPFSILKNTTSRATHIQFLRKTNLASVSKSCKDYLKHPMHVALLFWFFSVDCFLSLLFLLMTGLVDDVFPTDAMRRRWIEICNQVLNMLFTLMSLYEHPDLVHHLVMLCRWRPQDIASLRKIYCKNGAPRPHERAHMAVVLSFLHLSCFAQYALCGLYWAYTSKNRPEFSDDLCEILGVLLPVSAALYTVYSPLGAESHHDDIHQTFEEGSSSSKRRRATTRVVLEPEWAGELRDCGDDMVVGNLSCLCTCCVFGWNMERMGMGNMYVHTVTFLLLCIAPYWVFGITALNIHNRTLRRAVKGAGVVVSWCGLLYGGYWRVQLRRRLRLPGKRWCCGSRTATDYAEWMVCWPCALAQEVRTGNVYEYDEEDGSVYRKGGGAEDAIAGVMVAPLQPAMVDGSGEAKTTTVEVA